MSEIRPLKASMVMKTRKRKKEGKKETKWRPGKVGILQLCSWATARRVSSAYSALNSIWSTT
jgi:hypothetical protein